MKRRNFMKAVGLAISVGAVAGSAAAGEAQPGAKAAPAYKKLSRVTAVVTSDNAPPAELTFVDATPQRVPGARQPLAMVVEDGLNDVATIKFTLFRPQPDGSLKRLATYYTDNEGVQTIGSYGVVIKFSAVAKGRLN
jgi:hypothetical protein